MNLTKIQKQLEQKYPEFRSRRRLLEYYVSYEFPDKQIKLLNWWREMIESAFRYSEGVELAASDLEFLFTVHQLKPTPLVSVLNRLEIIGAIQWRNRSFQSQSNGWVRRALRSIWSNSISINDWALSKWKDQRSLLITSNSTILSVKYKSEALQSLKRLIEEELGQEQAIKHSQILKKARENADFPHRSIELLLGELEITKWLVVKIIEREKIVFHAEAAHQFHNENWLEVAVCKYTLKSKIQHFQSIIKQKEKGVFKIRSEIKELLLKDPSSNNSKAKRMIAEALSLNTQVELCEVRAKALKRALDQLQTQQLNGVTVKLMIASQQAFQKIMQEQFNFEEIKEKDIDIKMRQKEFDQLFREFNQFNEDEERAAIGADADRMLLSLQNDIKGSRAQQKKAAREKEIQLQ